MLARAAFESIEPRGVSGVCGVRALLPSPPWLVSDMSELSLGLLLGLLLLVLNARGLLGDGEGLGRLIDALLPTGDVVLESFVPLRFLLFPRWPWSSIPTNKKL